MGTSSTRYGQKILALNIELTSVVKALEGQEQALVHNRNGWGSMNFRRFILKPLTPKCRVILNNPFFFFCATRKTLLALSVTEVWTFR